MGLIISCCLRILEMLQTVTQQNPGVYQKPECPAQQPLVTVEGAC